MVEIFRIITIQITDDAISDRMYNLATCIIYIIPNIFGTNIPVGRGQFIRRQRKVQKVEKTSEEREKCRKISQKPIRVLHAIRLQRTVRVERYGGATFSKTRFSYRR